MKIMLIDLDRPNEPLEVEVEEYSHLTVRVGVPNTLVRFEMRRQNANAPFEGALGGRHFLFDPAPPVQPRPRRQLREKARK